MRLNFDTIGGFPFELEVDSTDTLQDIKLKIEINKGFSVSSQTLIINGNIIANDADLLAAAITDGSQIQLDIAADPFDLPDFDFSSHDDLVPASDSDFFHIADLFAAEASSSTAAAEASTSTQPTAAAEASTSTQPPLSQFQSPVVDEIMNIGGDSPLPPPRNFYFLVKMPEPFGKVNFEATDNEAILEIKQSIRDMTKVPVGRIVLKDQHGKEFLDGMTLLQYQISDDSELTAEFLPSPTEASPSSSPPPMLRLMRAVDLEYNKVRVAVEVVAALKMSQLRSMLESDARNFDLPDSYYFLHNEAAIDENASFFSQNIAEGGIIEIISGHHSRGMFLKLETRNHNSKAYFEVATHSDHTIRRLKEEIGRNEGIPVDRILIKRNGIEQPDHKALHACSITSDYGVTVEILEKKEEESKRAKDGDGEEL